MEKIPGPRLKFLQESWEELQYKSKEQLLKSRKNTEVISEGAFYESNYVKTSGWKLGRTGEIQKKTPATLWEKQAFEKFNEKFAGGIVRDTAKEFERKIAVETQGVIAQRIQESLIEFRGKSSKEFLNEF